MTFIAKAMNRTDRLEAAEKRAAGDEREGSAAAEYDAPPRPDAATSPPASNPSPTTAARAIGILKGPAASDVSALPPLESGTPGMTTEEGDSVKRPWWKEPMFLGGLALGGVALMAGFLFAPSDIVPPRTAASNTSPLLGDKSDTPVQGDASEVHTPSEISETDTGRADPTGTARNPVVVRVEIDSSDGRRVSVDHAENDRDRAAVIQPGRPEEITPLVPLEPLELPPPPIVDPSLDAPKVSSRYVAAPSAPPVGDSIADYRLEGIFYDEISPAAIINDEIVEVGERVDHLRVLEIHKTHLVVDLNGRTFDLR